MAEYTLIYFVPAEATIAIAPNILVISERVKGATVEWVPLWLCVLLQMGVLIGGEVLVGGRRSCTGGDSASMKLCGYQQYLYY